MARNNQVNISFKENMRDIELYVFLKEQGEKYGVSSYIKLLIEKDMEQKKKEQK